MTKNSNMSKDLTTLLAAAGIALTANSVSASAFVSNIEKSQEKDINSASVIFCEIDAAENNLCLPDGQCNNRSCS